MGSDKDGSCIETSLLLMLLCSVIGSGVGVCVGVWILKKTFLLIDSKRSILGCTGGFPCTSSLFCSRASLFVIEAILELGLELI